MKKIKNKYIFLNNNEIKKVVNLLEKNYKNATCGLNFTSAFELAIALILAAQCTDNMVNKTTPILFNKYKDVAQLANANEEDLKKIIKSCGFYNTKAKNIIKTSKKILNDFNNEVPHTMNELLTLHGIARKSSNIILQECFNISEGIAVDTHVTRLSYRIGFTSSTIQNQIEKDLMDKINKKYYSKINHFFVEHGRKYCTARNPKCDECFLNNICKKNI